MTTAVKYFHSNMGGAPQLDNVWGCMVSLLDAVLVNGFNLKSVAQLNRVGNVATMTIGSGHGFEVNQVVLIAGADQTEYNGEFRVTAITSNSVSFVVSGSPVTPATGSITVKAAPLKFNKIFSEGATKAAYQSSDPASTGNILRVFDYQPAGYTGQAKGAMVSICNGLADVNTLSPSAYEAPFLASLPNANWTVHPTISTSWGWFKWMYAHAGSFTTNPGNGSRSWVIIGDSRAFYLFNRVNTGVNYYGRTSYFFGDINPLRSTDVGSSMLSACDAYGVSSFLYSDTNNGMAAINSYNSSNRGLVTLRPSTIFGSYPTITLVSMVAKNGQDYGSGFNGGVPWPNPSNYGLIVSKCMASEVGGYAIRGDMPGMYTILNNTCPLADLEVVSNVAGYENRKFLNIRHSCSTLSAQSVGNSTYPDGGAMTLFDMNTSWR